MIEEKIRDLVNESLQANEFNECYIYDLSIGGNKINVFLESDDAVTFLICRKVSRHVEEYLDEIEWHNGQYTTDVSSPGVGSPLKFARQYPKNVGRTIEVKYGEGQKVKGLMTRADNESIDVSFKERIKEGKKKKTVEIVETIQIEDIREAKIKITF